MAWPIYAATALQAAGTARSLLSKPKSISVPDISGELARIRAYYDQAAATARANLKQEAGEQRGLAASNLAARGIYSSPVSENVFGRMREALGRDIATSEANIGVQSANAQAQALGALLGANQQAQQFNAQQQAQRQAAIYGGLGSLGSSLLGFGLSGMGGKPGASPMNPMAGGPVQFGYGSSYPAGPWGGQQAYNLVQPYGPRL